MARRSTYPYSRKRRPKYKNIIITLVIVIFIVIATPRVMLMTKGYSFTATNNILFNNVEVEYSSNINKIFSSKKFEAKNIENYLEVVSYLEVNDLVVSSKAVTSYINDLISKEYSLNAVKIIIATHDDEELEVLVQGDKDVFIEEMAALDFFRLEFYDEYIEYYKTFRKTAYKIVLEVNMRVNYEPFDAAVSNQYERIDGYDHLINHFNQLPDDYEPTDLVRLQGPNFIMELYLDAQAAESYEELRQAALKAGHTIGVRDAFRTHQQQSGIYDNRIKKYEDQGMSEEEAIRKTREYVAVPGHSEHQTGLAIDWFLPYDNYCKSGKCLQDTDAYAWLRANMGDYGFILRYPSGKTKYTNISFEPWHLRYIGVEIATYINDNGITLEEWYALGKKLD